jgi:hypothetical protein
MAYKARFSPLEILKPGGWSLMSARERGARPPSTRGGAKDPCDLPLSDAEPAEIEELG